MPRPERPPGQRPADGTFSYVGMDVGAAFLNKPGARPNINAYLAHWRRDMDINQQEARQLYEDDHLFKLREMDLLNTVFDDYADLVEYAAQLPIDPNDIPTPPQ